MDGSDPKFYALMSKIFYFRTKHRHYTSRILHKSNRSQLKNLIELWRIRSCLNQERLFGMKAMLQMCILHKHHKSSFWWDHAKSKFSHNQWLKYVRMGKDNFMLLVDKITPYFKLHSITNLSIEKQTAITLISMASGKNNACIGRLFLISKSEIAISIENICEAIKCLMPQYLKVPGILDIKNSTTNFENKWGFPQCVGVIGSIHVPLQKSNLPENASDYINNNGEYSMLLQGVVDSSYKFFDVNIGWPGGAPESRVFTNSAFWQKGQDRDLFPDINEEICGVKIPIYILAGTSYPLSHWVLGPFLDESSSEKEKLFNENFTFAYNIIEIAFKRLKARWNCLIHGNICNIEILPSVIVACCVLHNMCELNNEMMLNDWILTSENFFKQPIPLPCSTVIGPQAENIRSAVSEYFVNSKI